jgi:hypothetical protein
MITIFFIMYCPTKVSDKGAAVNDTTTSYEYDAGGTPASYIVMKKNEKEAPIEDYSMASVASVFAIQKFPKPSPI